MKTNRATLAQLQSMVPKQVDDLPLDQVHGLLEANATAKADAKAADDKLSASLGRRFSDIAVGLRKHLGKDTGRVSIDDGEFIIRADLPSKVEWDEGGLADIERQLETMEEPPSDYIKRRLTVMEGAYQKWPGSIRKMFEPHRTVGVGKATFLIERKKGAA